MFCVKCGIELSDGQELCPACGTKVILPEGEETKPALPTYPKKPITPDMSAVTEKHGFLFALTGALALVCIVCLLIDYMVNLSFEWANFVTGSIVLFYMIFVLPAWLKKYYPITCTLIAFVSLALFLLYIAHETNGVTYWFLPFALPLVGTLATIVTTTVGLCAYLPSLRLITIGSAISILGMTMLGLEPLIRFTFDMDIIFTWSPFVFAFLMVVGIMLVIVSLVPKLRASLKKLFFL